MTKRLFTALLGLLLAIIALPAAATPPAAPCTVLGCGDDVTWAANLETQIQQNTENGQVFEIDKDPATGAITSINHFGDSALWTGTYLAAESYRYALAQNSLRGPLTSDARDYWKAQREDAKPRIDAMIAKFHLLANISKNWTN